MPIVHFRLTNISVIMLSRDVICLARISGGWVSVMESITLDMSLWFVGN